MMPRKLTQEEFVRRAIKAHGGRYTYEKAIFTKYHAKVIITCAVPGHGDFPQIALNHLHGAGCPKCKHAASFNTNDQFVVKASKKHNGKYTYPRTVYVDIFTKVTITCSKHGDFLQNPSYHLQGQGCPKCKGDACSERKTKTNKKFISEAITVHGKQYDYSKVVYIRTHEKIIIICRHHGEFKQRPLSHLRGEGCPTCRYETNAEKNRKPLEQFIKDAREVHGIKYGYEKFVYRTTHTKGIITCPDHGDFEATPNAHLHGESGCPDCNESKGERLVAQILERLGEQFVRQARIIPSNKMMAFDFHLPARSVLIEFNGEQHYKPVRCWRGVVGLEAIRARDTFKRRWAQRNGFRLITISYLVEDVADYLTRQLADLKADQSKEA